MDGDPLLTGTASNFPNQNSTAAPTTWVEDLTQAAAQGIPCGTGPMLQPTQRHTGQQFLPTGEFNPCADPAGVCLVATNIRTDVSPSAASEARLASGLIGGSFVGGTGTIRGIGVFGLGRGQNGVLGIGGFTTEGGLASGSGVEGRTVATAPDTAGVKGTGQVGVMGVAAPGGRAGEFNGDVQVNGNLVVSGSKSAVVRHPDGSSRMLFAVEAPESWFEDFGRAELTQGRAEVVLDPEFVAVAQTGGDYHVFVTPEGECNGLYVTNRTSSSFEVVELQAGTSDTSFSFRVIARRGDLDPGRLPVAESAPATTDEAGRDAWASTPAPSWPPESAQWPEHLAPVFKPAGGTDEPA